VGQEQPQGTPLGHAVAALLPLVQALEETTSDKAIGSNRMSEG
jgi:hypothetical protein